MRQGAGTLGGATLRVTPGADEGSYSVVVDVDASEGFVNDLHGELLVIDPSQPAGTDAHTTRLPISSLTAPGRYEATVLGVARRPAPPQGRALRRGPDPRRLAAEAVGQVSVPYPRELAPDQLGADPAWLASLSPETGTSNGPLADILTTPGAPKGTRTRPIWPEVLWALVLPLLLLDLLLRRIALGRPRRGRLG
jgi:Ca-activated chloride channel family protein